MHLGGPASQPTNQPSHQPTSQPTIQPTVKIIVQPLTSVGNQQENPVVLGLSNPTKHCWWKPATPPVTHTLFTHYLRLEANKKILIGLGRIPPSELRTPNYAKRIPNSKSRIWARQPTNNPTNHQDYCSTINVGWKPTRKSYCFGPKQPNNAFGPEGGNSEFGIPNSNSKLGTTSMHPEFQFPNSEIRVSESWMKNYEWCIPNSDSRIPNSTTSEPQIARCTCLPWGAETLGKSKKVKK